VCVGTFPPNKDMVKWAVFLAAGFFMGYWDLTTLNGCSGLPRYLSFDYRAVSSSATPHYWWLVSCLAWWRGTALFRSYHCFTFKHQHYFRKQKLNGAAGIPFYCIYFAHCYRMFSSLTGRWLDLSSVTFCTHFSSCLLFFTNYYYWTSIPSTTKKPPL
jgi:hypothetical protein